MLGLPQNPLVGDVEIRLARPEERLRWDRNRKGSRHLRAAFVEAAHAAARTRNCQFASFKRTVAARRGSKRAPVATAHKMTRILYVMLRDAVPYRDPVIDYEKLTVGRNASHWPRQLGQFGIIEPRDDGSLRVNRGRVEDSTTRDMATTPNRTSPGVDDRKACLRLQTMLNRNAKYCASARSQPGSDLRAEPGTARAYSRQNHRNRPARPQPAHPAPGSRQPDLQ